jgi:adenylate cyclase
MALEIERKFLVKANSKSWLKHATPSYIRQGYLCDDVRRSVRVRINEKAAFLTIKGQTVGMSRHEYEYAIPVDDAEKLLAMCVHSIIVKTRHTLNIDGLIWEVDEFHHDNKGLIIAEVELDHVEQHVSLPEWIASEVTDDPRFYNLALCQHPYNIWVK